MPGIGGSKPGPPGQPWPPARRLPPGARLAGGPRSGLTRLTAMTASG